MSRRAGEIASSLLVAVCMAAGWLLHLSANAYLIIRIPLVVAFQCCVRRQPLVRLWHFDRATLAPTRRTIVLAAIAGACPAFLLVAHWPAIVGEPGRLAEALWLIAAILGAWGVATSFDRPSKFAWWRDRSTRALWITIVFVGAAVHVLAAWQADRHLQGDALSLATAVLRDVVLYANVGFVLEEVAFRGAFDAAVAPDRATRGSAAWASALFVSLLWSLWHLPLLLHDATDVPNAIRSVIFHVGLGSALSMLARQSRCLAPAVFAHAVINAVRNTWA